MKKVLALALVLALSVSLVACKGKEAPASTEPTTAPVTSEAADNSATSQVAVDAKTEFTTSYTALTTLYTEVEKLAVDNGWDKVDAQKAALATVKEFITATDKAVAATELPKDFTYEAKLEEVKTHTTALTALKDVVSVKYEAPKAK